MSAPLARLSQLQQTINAYRAAILTADDAALVALQEAYAPSRERLLDQIERTVQAVAADGTITQTEATQLGRAQELLRLVDLEAQRLAKVTGQIVPLTQQQAVSQALQTARELTVLQSPTLQQAARNATDWTALRSDAVADLVGSLSDGSPLSEWVKALPKESILTVRDTLVDGVARGINAADLGRALARATDLPLHRAMSLARTETLRSYRSASIRAMQANDDILKGWRWVSAHQTRTCTACLALSGQDFPLTVQFMAAHVNCRCSPAPLLKDDSLLPRLQTGQQWFDQQPEKYRREALPIGLRGDYDAGRIDLQDMVYLYVDETWGDSYQVSSITQARANAARRRSGGASIAAGG